MATCAPYRVVKARVCQGERRDVVHPVVYYDPAVLEKPVLAHLLAREFGPPRCRGCMLSQFETNGLKGMYFSTS